MFVLGRFLFAPLFHTAHAITSILILLLRSKSNSVSRVQLNEPRCACCIRSSGAGVQTYRIPTLLWSPSVILSALGLIGDLVMVECRPMRLSSMR